MPRAKTDLEKVTIRLHAGDKSELDEFYPRSGHNRVIRNLVHQHIKMLREKLNQQRSTLDDDIEPGDITDGIGIE